MYQRLLVATDGSELAEHAVDNAIGLARALKASIVLYNAGAPAPPPVVTEGVAITPVVDRDEYESSVKLHADEILAAAARKADAAGVPYQAAFSMDAASPAESIIAAAQEHDCDLIVMASHGRTGLAALLMGSETSNVLKHTKLPVLVVH